MEVRAQADIVEDVSYDAGFIVLSYFVSLVGCVTTLKLLHRRTSTKGLYNWFLLVASCITMGGSGIWAMHFIADRAIVLHSGVPNRQISYSPGFTALSFFLPILVLMMAFYFLASTNNAKPLFIILAGILTGTAVCGMHYLGDYGIANYTCHYRVWNVVGAAIIAVVASLIALSVFFRLRETWTDTWWKRTACAAILASAVVGMHWTAAVGTRYQFKGASDGTGYASRVQTVIVCALLSVSACVILMAIVLLRGRKIRLTRTRAQQVVLACGYFDQNGRLMLTRDGTLPCEKITNRFVEKVKPLLTMKRFSLTRVQTFGEDELSRSHPTFAWIFKASRNWPALKEMIPGMSEHLASNPAARKYTPGSTSPSSKDDGSESSTSFGPIFKQLFCVAAQRLAITIHEPLENVGVLFEEPLETGALHLSGIAKASISSAKFSLGSKSSDVERDGASTLSFGRGKYLFLNRMLSKTEVDTFAAMGYRFGSIQQVSERLSTAIEVPADIMKTRLDRMRLVSSVEHHPPPGVHMTCFMLRPSVHNSFDVLVPMKTQNQLPLTTIQPDDLKDWQSALLTRFDEWTVKDILKTLINEAGCLDMERDFRWRFHTSIIRLLDLVGDFDSMMSARFSAKQIHTPCRIATETHSPSACTLFTIRLMNAVHARAQKEDMTYIPLSFFSAQQQAESAKPDHEAFARGVEMEFGYRPRPITDLAVRNSMRSSKRASMDFLHHRFNDFDPPTPTSLSRFKNVLRPNSQRKSEEKAIVQIRDLSVGTSDDKCASETEDISGYDDVPTPAGTPTADDFGERPHDGDYVQRLSGYRHQGHGDDRGIELTAISTDEGGGWVAELFGLFGLKAGHRP